MIKTKNMKIVVGMATMNTRQFTINQVFESMNNQTIKIDKMFVYNNDMNIFDATDNGKFYYFETKEYQEDLESGKEVYFFSIDDDIVYPKTYIEDTIKAINKYNCVVTYHGRNLTTKSKYYYQAPHIDYQCKKEQDYSIKTDVLGTGVTAFNINYIKPDIFNQDKKRMSDLLLSLQIAKEGKRIINLERRKDYFKMLYVDLANSCYFNEKANPVQAKVANEIYDLTRIKPEDIQVYITHYNRLDLLHPLIDNVKNHNLDYLILDDNTPNFEKEMEKTDYKYVSFDMNGKEHFYKKFQYIYDHFNNTDKKYIIIIPDDFKNIDFQRLINDINIKHTTNDIIKIIRDYRTNCWHSKNVEEFNDNFYKEYFIDCAFACDRVTFNLIGRIPKIISQMTGSGVGTWYTNRIKELDLCVLSPKNSYAYHGEHLSVMHEEERKINPLISLFEDKQYEIKMTKEI